MGVLDDAIREHLELKRRHGVPEEELQRQEDEALGPARRDVAQQHEEAEPAAGHTATAEADEPAAPAPADEETALFDMEAGADADGPASAEAPALDEAPVDEHPPAPEPPPAEPAADAPPAPSRSIEIKEPGEAAVGEPGHEPDPQRALGDTQPHGFEAIEDEDLESEASTGSGLSLTPDEEEREPDDEELLSADEEAAAEEGDPDVLEDTPDFLQETPEHDRLWFEQKPPRDFDFD
jgi:hypothetical protein